MKKILYYAIALLLGIMACAESEIETWKAKPRVWFTKANDTIIFSFYSQPAEITEVYGGNPNFHGRTLV